MGSPGEWQQIKLLERRRALIARVAARVAAFFPAVGALFIAPIGTALGAAILTALGAASSTVRIGAQRFLCSAALVRT